MLNTYWIYLYLNVKKSYYTRCSLMQLGAQYNLYICCGVAIKFRAPISSTSFRHHFGTTRFRCFVLNAHSSHNLMTQTVGHVEKEILYLHLWFSPVLCILRTWNFKIFFKGVEILIFFLIFPFLAGIFETGVKTLTFLSFYIIT